MGEVQPYMTNKELFLELRKDLHGLRDDIHEVRSELKSTQKAMKEYNGLRGDLATCKQDIQELKNRREARQEVLDAFIKISKWVIIVVSFFAAYFTFKG